MLTLEEWVEDDRSMIDKWMKSFVERDDCKSKMALNFLFYHEKKGVLDIKNGFYEGVKNEFYLTGALDAYRVIFYNDRIFDYGLRHVGMCLLSDSEELISLYSRLRYRRGHNAELSMEEMVHDGERPIWVNTIQYLMVGDLKSAARNLEIIERSTLGTIAKNDSGLVNDYAFLKSLIDRDKSKAEEVLDKLVTPRVHSARNDSGILKKYISLPALGYAKLAWRMGMEVEVNSPLVPRQLLPFSPLPEYQNPYPFLVEMLAAQQKDGGPLPSY